MNINNKAAHRQTDHWVEHCNNGNCHDSNLKEGSSSVFINGLAAGRVGDQIACNKDDTIASGSSNVFIGG